MMMAVSCGAAVSWMLVALLLVSREALSLRHRLLPKTVQNSAPVRGYNYQTRFFDQKVDHFNAGESTTFKQRYLVNTAYWGGGGKPIFLYTGNEGDITWFCNNTGFMWDIAPAYSAMLLFVEHRYYGQSLPFGNDSFKDVDHLQFLTSTQALADFATFITAFQKELVAVYNTSSPVIAFGGSYGGMLAAWLRMKYPSVVQGAIAASAPIWFFSGLTPCSIRGPYQVVTQDFESSNPNCSANVHRSWAALDKVAAETSGLQWLSTTFHLCEPLTDVEDFKSWIEDTWFNLAMVDYPYPADFLEPLPAWPVKETCKYLATDLEDEHQLLQALASAVGVYYNSSGQVQCLNTSVTANFIGQRGWNFQACTRMVMPMCSDGVHDMFFDNPWNLTAYEMTCHEEYGVEPDPYWVETVYGGKNISMHSNIVFSNGLLDPWHVGGVLQSLSESLVAVVIPSGAHHIDMRASNPADPPDVKAARKTEEAAISKWLLQYYREQTL